MVTKVWVGSRQVDRGKEAGQGGGAHLDTPRPPPRRNTPAGRSPAYKFACKLAESICFNDTVGAAASKPLRLQPDPWEFRRRERKK
ncbi:hypothetical protein E2C01_072849 [Portunus trituberculatus]|uniref:Uncharacterized protein n=1 Tax=Portunus trituberculatus TaxID=210409 RepID=A0A5B7ICH4_PORTR|nr:hypothetical protein [Portunus trituberculatus]